MEELKKQQNLFETNLGISITNDCPLKCSHCLTNANELGKKIIFKDFLNIVEKSPLIEEINLTGGEPFLEYELLLNISNYLEKNKKRLTIMTSGFWATSLDTALEKLKLLKSLTSLGLSYDKYHLEYLPIEYIKNAYKAAKLLNIKVKIRITDETLDSLKENKDLFQIINFITTQEDIEFQPLINLGRAEFLDTAKRDLPEFSAYLPCLSSGLFINSLGDIKPCCRPVAYLKQKTLLDLGTIDEMTEDLHTIATKNWILNHIRIFGIPDLLNYLNNPLLKKYNINFENKLNCDLCAEIFSNDEISRELKYISDTLAFKLKVAGGLKKYFNNEEGIIILKKEYNL